MGRFLAIGVLLIASSAAADPRPFDVHGFVSEGGFWSTSNDYIGASSRGSLELFQVGLNVSTEVADRLRAGVQLFARNEGTFQDLSPRIDWAFLDYQWKPWLGLRAGIIKMPFGLYNEYSDADAARVSLLMPQAIYPIGERDVLLGHRGFSLYGNHAFDAAGALEYQAWIGQLIVPDDALVLSGGSIDRVDSRYVAGAQLFWHTPVEGLKVGATAVRTSIDFHTVLDANVLAQLVGLGLVPADFDGKVLITDRPNESAIGSAEYVIGDLQLAAEYAVTFTRQRTSLPDLIPTTEQTSERYYGMATYRLSPHVAGAASYSASYANIHDRHGHDPKYAHAYQAFQRDAAATLRLDVNDHWLWKLEGHFIDGATDLNSIINPNPTRYWGMFLVRTTVTF